MIPAEDKRGINESSIRQFFSAWEPRWRWMLILGLRDMRANLDRLGALAAEEVGHESWAEDGFLYGPVALGLTAAAVNECAQYCEDLFALLTFLQDPTDFARRMGSYSAGKVTGLAGRLKDEDDAAICKRFLFPPRDTVKAGLGDAEDPAKALTDIDRGIECLGTLVREIADWYLTYEFFHLQYKHGLKIPLRPFGPVPSEEAIEERKASCRAPLFAFSNEPLNKMVARPPGQQAVMLQLTPLAQRHLTELVNDRALLRIQPAGPDVDLDAVVKIAWTVQRLLELAIRNRISINEGADSEGLQTFELPGPDDPRQGVTARLKLTKPLGLNDLQA